jgi:archaellum component FlaG (FlaF/FlaG flagellin family)
MRYFHAKSFAFVASIVGAAWMAGALCAPMAALATAMNPKPSKKATASVVVVVANSRDVALTELDATPAGLYLPKKILSNLAPGKKASATVATDKDCVFDLHGVYADGSTTDSTSVDLCKDQNVNLVQ